MFDTQHSIDQEELDTQQSQSFLQPYPSQNFQSAIDSLRNIMLFNYIEDQTQNNEQESQEGVQLQEISSSSEYEKQTQQPKDFVFTTYHPSVLFGEKKYNTYKKLFSRESIGIDNSEEVAEEQYRESDDIRDQIHSNLALIKSQLKNFDKKQRNPARNNINQRQIVLFEEQSSNQSNLSLSDIDSIMDQELNDEYNHGVEKKIQNYNSNCNILEKFTTQYKSQSQIENF
ncbi:unnamed protein product [Paramecium pentaurelia]|uniref:Uncharacterized protein n=1 Tax=Paramecium pentaurelia TaxID=43138 RepID=A0A8S1WP00_9CILI|nr:unnamed protein product [Paramecium pentaurelia]